MIFFIIIQQSQPVNSQISSQPQINSFDQQSSAHHRANSGPTIAISLFPEGDNSNGM